MNGLPRRPARGCLKRTGTAGLDLDRQRDDQQDRRHRDEEAAGDRDVEDALGGLGDTREARGADRQQRDAADLLDGLRAVEELEEAGDDVHRDALLAAGAQHVQELLVARAREGDHHALDVVPAQDVAQVVEAAEDRDVEAEVVVDLVVDDADRVQPVLAVAAQAVRAAGRPRGPSR